jgi:uncharacterized protein YcbK (DUF882 family)
MNSFFSLDELKCPFSNRVALEEGFLDHLTALRQDFGSPMIITSGCRSPEYNKITPKAHQRSLHLMGNPYHKTDTIAVDVSVMDSAIRRRLLFHAILKGWSVGVASNFLHLDLRTMYLNLPQIVFHYRR